MDKLQIIKLISQPESQTLEFKERASRPDIIARILSSFANTDGGMLLLGRGLRGAVIGVKDVDDAMTKIKKAIDKIVPRPQVLTSIEMIDGKPVILLDIKKSTSGPLSVGNLLFQRSGTDIKPVASKNIFSSFAKSQDTVEHINDKLMQLSLIIENQNKQLIHMQTWRSKLVDMFIGGIIGAAISIIIQFLL